MAALMVFGVFLVSIALSIPIATSMILGSISPILLLGKMLDPPLFWQFRCSSLAALSWQRVVSPEDCLTSLLIS